MLDFEAPKPGTGAGVGILDDEDGVGDVPILGFGDAVVLGGRDGVVVAMAEWTSLFDICFDRDEIAHPAIAPAAPVAEVTRPAWPVPFWADVVVTGPYVAFDSACTVSGWLVSSGSGMFETHHVLYHTRQAADKHVHRLERLVPYEPGRSVKISCRQDSYAHFSLSTRAKAMLGMTFPARSSRSNTSTVAIRAINPATLAWTNGSFRLRANAGTKTFFLVLGPSIGASLPSRIHVLVLIDGSESVCIFANNLNKSLLSVRSLSLDASGKTALTVASRMTGTVSAKPVI